MTSISFKPVVYVSGLSGYFRLIDILYRGGCALTFYLGPGRTRATITRSRQIGKPPQVLLVLDVMDIGYREINTPDFTTSPKSRWERLPEWLHYPMAIQDCHPAAPSAAQPLHIHISGSTVTLFTLLTSRQRSIVLVHGLCIHMSRYIPPIHIEPWALGCYLRRTMLPRWD